MVKATLAALTLLLGAHQALAAVPTAIEPRLVSWNIVSDQEMSKICRQHGLRANCEGMAAWNSESRSCVIWTRSPRAVDDMARWQVVHHELTHCQDGNFHD